MRTAIVLLVARPRRKRDPVNYLIGYHHVVESLRLHHASLPEIVVLSPDLDTPPPGADTLLRIDPKPFEVIRKTQSAFGRSVYYKLAIFQLNYDRILYLDTDMLVLGDLSELWDPDRYQDCGLYGVREDASLGLTHPVWQGKINAGMLLVNPSRLPRSTFQDLLTIAATGDSYDAGDQGVLHAYFSRPEMVDRVGELPARYNVPSCARVDGDWERYRDDIRILHYLGPRKPWAKTPEHRWYHDETQAIWDRAVAQHAPVPETLLELGRWTTWTRCEAALLRALRWPLRPFLGD